MRAGGQRAAPLGSALRSLVAATLGLMSRDVDRVADVRGAANHLEGLGEAAEDGGQREDVERRADTITPANIGDEVTHSAHRADQRHEADGDLRDGARQTQFIGEVAEKEPG